MRPVKVSFGNGSHLQEVSVGAHRFHSDTDLALGGEGRGPLPGEYLAAALGTCIGMTLRMYARRKAWALEDVETEVVLKRGALTELHCTIRISGELSDEQRSRLFELANRCPVHRALTHGATIEMVQAESRAAPGSIPGTEAA